MQLIHLPDNDEMLKVEEMMIKYIKEYEYSEIKSAILGRFERKKYCSFCGFNSRIKDIRLVFNFLCYDIKYSKYY